MIERALRSCVRLHDRTAHLSLGRDEAGLSMLAYAIGAAVVVVPLAFAIAFFGGSSVQQSHDLVNGAIANASTP